jgi:hypothetical protein
MKKKLFHPINTLFLIGFLMLFAACAIPSLVIKINTSQDPQARFEQYRTYNWYASTQATAAPSGPMGHTNLQAHLKKAIEQEIAKKGLQKDEDRPDLLLAYDVSLPKPAPATPQPHPAGFDHGLAGQMGLHYDYGHANIAAYQPVASYAPGTILIDVIDARTRELIWRGWAEEVIENFNADYKTIVNYVDDIIDKYPHQKVPRP